jgi:PKD repeat protein
VVTIVTPPTAGFTASPTSGCEPLTVQFTSTSSTNSATYNWQFPGGTPSSSTAQNPLVVYNSAGTYSVTLTVSNAAGSSTAVQNNYITANPKPVSAFTSSTAGSTATFANSSTNATSYTWDFGDMGTSTDQNPVHTYAGDGTYTVVLTATGPCGTNTSTKTVSIGTPPTASFTATPTYGCSPLVVHFTSTSSTNSSGYEWQFPGGSPSSSTEQNPTVTYNSSGVYSVTLTVSNVSGTSSATQSDYIQVAGPTFATFASSVLGSTAFFGVNSSSADSYSWDFGDGGTGTGFDTLHTYANDGVYTVVMTATGPCGSIMVTDTVTIATPPTAGFTANMTSGCVPLTVQFTSTSSTNTTGWNWQFPGGSPSSSTQQNPTVTYNTAGVYSVTLTASNATGTASTTQTNYIVVNPKPIANFSPSVTGSTVAFTNNSTNATGYNWNFGDGTGSNLAAPQHTYSADGTYTVVLTATNGCGENTLTQTVVILTAATAGFTANTTAGCGPLTVQFTNLSSANTTSWEWTFPGGTPSSSTEKDPVVVYDVPGTYNVTLLASTGTTSNTYTQNGFITVYPLPTAGFTPTVNGATVNFSNTSTNANAYLWNFGDGNSSLASDPSHKYTTDGTYTVTLTATNICGSITTTQEVVVVTPPTAAFTQSASSGCAPLTVQFSNQSTANSTSYAWSFPGGTPSISNQPNPMVIWTDPGTYVVTLVSSNSAGSSTATATITVNTVPVAGFTSQTAGTSVVLSNTSTGASTYLWDFGDGSTSAEASPTHNYGTTSSFTVTLTATNECGSTTTTHTVEIMGAPPIASFSANNTTGCLPFTVNFTDQSAGNPTIWQWSFEGGFPTTSGLQNPTVTYNTPGTYSVTLMVFNAYGNNTATSTHYITVQAPPTAGFNSSSNLGTVTFTNQSQNANSYVWTFGDGNTSMDPNPVHTYTASGTYTVELTALNNCGATTIQQTVTVNVVGTSEPSWLNSLKLYPNPNYGVFTVEMAGEPNETVNFQLFNDIGQLIRVDKVDFGTGNLHHVFNYGNLPGAVYTLRIQSGEKTAYVKVVIQ